jgi:hypothetical protein
MQRYLDDGYFVQRSNLEYDAIAGHILICGQIACLGKIVITVEKALEVLDLEALPLDARVKTVEYSYNASIRGFDAFMRYDNQHPHAGHLDQHHRHYFNWRNGKERHGSPEWVGEKGWPTLSDFIDEVYAWYSEHHLDLPEPNGVAELDNPYVRRLFSDL